MHISRLALASAAWLAVTGAALPQDSQIRAIAECRLPREAAFAAMKQLPVENQIDKSVAPGRNITTFYKLPAGLTVHGYPVVFFASADIHDASDERVLFMATVKGPYDEVERTVLAANGVTACDQRSDEGKGGNCGVYQHDVDGWRVSVVLQQYDDDVGIACSFSRDPQ
jgi:hypothetical protein